MDITVTVTQTATTSSEVAIREHRVTVDRPQSKHGTNAGPQGGELLLASLGGCFMSNLLEVIRTREVPITDAQVTVVGTVEGTPSRYTAVTMTVTATTDDREQLEKFVTMAERACLVSNTLRDALALTVTVA
jgi:putative redox protein